jgi:hypothetical protein
MLILPTMNNDTVPGFSRRGWFAPAAAAALTPALAQQSPPRPPAASAIYNVRDFGAKGDNKMLDTAAVQAAIDACAKRITEARCSFRPANSWSERWS